MTPAAAAGNRNPRKNAAAAAQQAPQAPLLLLLLRRLDHLQAPEGPTTAACATASSGATLGDALGDLPHPDGPLVGGADLEIEKKLVFFDFSVFQLKNFFDVVFFEPNALIFFENYCSVEKMQINLSAFSFRLYKKCNFLG